MLAGVMFGDFVLELELSEAERLRMCDAGAAAIADAYDMRLREAADALARIVHQRAEHVSRMRSALVGTYLRDLERGDADDHVHDDDLNTSEVGDGSPGAPGPSPGGDPSASHEEEGDSC